MCGACIAFGQSKFAREELSKKISPNRFTQLLDEVTNNELPLLVEFAFSTRNHQFLLACFENEKSVGLFLRTFIKLDDHNLQEHLLPTLLRASPKTWLEVKPGQVDLLAADRMGIANICIEILRRRIQTASLTINDFSSLSRRERLAADFESANKLHSEEHDQAKNKPLIVKTENLTPSVKAPPLVLPSTFSKALEDQLAATPSEDQTSSTPWSMIVVLIVAGCGLLWLLLKRRS